MTRGGGGAGPSRRIPFSRDTLAGDSLDAARALIGARLVREDPGGRCRVGRIVEVEAYIGETDLASHARAGRTARNAPMFGAPGTAYVYLVYGMYHCLNVVTESVDRAAAVLVRAVEPLEGEAAMRAARLELARARGGRGAGADAIAGEAGRLSRLPVHRLAAGPGLVAAAFSIDRSATGVDLCDPGGGLRLEEAPAGEPGLPVMATPRIGIRYAGEPWVSVPWRFLDPRSPAVSGPPTVRRDRPTAATRRDAS